MNLQSRLRTILVVLVVAVAAPILELFAQAEDVLTFARPVLGTLANEQDVLVYRYAAGQAVSLSVQAVSETVAAAITIRDEDGIVAQETNSAGRLIVTLTTVLRPGEYSIEIRSVNSAVGPVLVAIQSEMPVVVQTLSPGALVIDEVSASVPVKMYSFSALAEPAVLTFDSALPDGGPLVRIVNVLTRAVVATVAPEWGGAIYSIPANGQTYELSITYSGRPTGEAFNLCFRAASGACEGTALAAQTGQNNSPACTVTPLQAGGANIRQSASTNAPIVTVLSGGQSASVIGLSPDNAWLNVTFGAITGWMARSAVVESGACAGVPVVQPPSFQPIAPPTQPPATPQPQPPQPPQPQPPAPTPIPTMSGPCTLTVTAPTFIYTQPIANVSYLGDQAQPAYQYFPNGRLADNSWWRLTTYNWWIETSTFGASVQVTGDCSSLPVVSP